MVSVVVGGDGRVDAVSRTGVDVRKLLQVAKFDYTMLFMVVADMVLKPSWTDFVSLGFIVLVLAAGVFFFLLNGLRSEPAAA